MDNGASPHCTRSTRCRDCSNGSSRALVGSAWLQHPGGEEGAALDCASPMGDLGSKWPPGTQNGSRAASGWSLCQAPAPKATRQRPAEEGAVCVHQPACRGPASPAELHRPALKSTEMKCTTLCTSSAAGGGKEHFLQMFPILRAKPRPGISQRNAQRNSIRKSLPC